MATSTELQTRVVIVGGPSTTMLPEVARSRPLIVPDKHVHEHAT